MRRYREGSGGQNHELLKDSLHLERRIEKIEDKMDDLKAMHYEAQKDMVEKMGRLEDTRPLKKMDESQMQQPRVQSRT